MTEIISPVAWDEQTFALKTVSVAAGFVGTSRANDRAQVARFLALFGLDFADSSGKPYSYCAAGVAYAACKAWAFLHKPQLPTDLESLKTYKASIEAHYFLPSASCGVMINDAKQRGTWVHRADIADGSQKPGWFVFYDWQGDGRADHIELVREGSDSTHLRTIGFNTTEPGADGSQGNGGAVARRVRPYDKVFGYLKPGATG